MLAVRETWLVERALLPPLRKRGRLTSISLSNANKKQEEQRLKEDEEAMAKRTKGMSGRAKSITRLRGLVLDVLSPVCAPRKWN